MNWLEANDTTCLPLHITIIFKRSQSNLELVYIKLYGNVNKLNSNVNIYLELDYLKLYGNVELVLIKL